MVLHVKQKIIPKSRSHCERSPVPGMVQGEVKQSPSSNRIATPACVHPRRATIACRHFGVQARTLQVLAITGGRKGFPFLNRDLGYSKMSFGLWISFDISIWTFEIELLIFLFS
jgi:hypothetical protein